MKLLGHNVLRLVSKKKKKKERKKTAAVEFPLRVPHIISPSGLPPGALSLVVLIPMYVLSFYTQAHPPILCSFQLYLRSITISV